MSDLRTASGANIRAACRNGKWTGPTPGLALGYVQANLVVLPRDWSYDFLLFCQRNPRPCPLLDVTEVGDPVPRGVAADADLRTDLPGYRVWENGVCVDQPTNVVSHWRDDLVAFVIGCSFTFENALMAAGLPVRHIELGVNVPMYRTNIPCRPAGRFFGPMVVSMRPMTSHQAIRATQICSRFGRAHGVPVHVGDPHVIGVSNIDKPDFGDPVGMRPGESPVFWACGVTPQTVLMAAKPPFAITHQPGLMFVTDWKDAELEGD